MTRKQKDWVYRALDRVKKKSGTEFQTVAIDWVCCEYLSGVGSVPARLPEAVPADAGRTPFRIYPHADQAETIDLAIETAKERIGAGDDAAAIVAICREVVETWAATYGDAPWPKNEFFTGGPDNQPDRRPRRPSRSRSTR